MPVMKLGGIDGRTIGLEESKTLLAMRTVSRGPLREDMLSQASRSILHEAGSYVDFAGQDIVLWDSGEVSPEDAKRRLREENQVEFVGTALEIAETHTPIVYTERLFVALQPDVTEQAVAEVMQSLGDRWVVERPLSYGQPCLLLRAEEPVGEWIFDQSVELLEHEAVDRCHPEFLRRRVKKSVFDLQWHLGAREIGRVHVDQSAHVEEAWGVTRGEGTTIAVIDDGVDMGHPEFSQSGKIVAPYDFTHKVADGSPKLEIDNHGTPCAGVACASGAVGASGVAPDARLMPIRLASGLGSIDESDAIAWASRQGADVISCSWGPEDGAWENPDDPRHFYDHPISDNSALALEEAIENGREGKGCVVCWAAGNGNESVDLDGYARFDGVMAVAACNDRGEKSVYSDYGNAIDCAFPSDDFQTFGEPPPVTLGIATTDRRGEDGYNSRPSPSGDYMDDFGGTSSACPGAAGAAALLLSADPSLTGRQIQDILKATADKIDPTNGDYDENGHSPRYGFGRINVARALGSVQ